MHWWYGLAKHGVWVNPWLSLEDQSRNPYPKVQSRPMSWYPSTCQIKSVNCDGSNVASGMEQDAWSWGISQSRLGVCFFFHYVFFFHHAQDVLSWSLVLPCPFFQTLNSVLSRICLFTVHRATMEVSRQDEITITFGTGKITGQCYQDQICARWPSVWLSCDLDFFTEDWSHLRTSLHLLTCSSSM